MARGVGPLLAPHGSSWPPAKWVAILALYDVVFALLPTLSSISCWRTEALTTYGRGLRGLSLAAAATITVALALVFFYAPLDTDQGFIQKIFYIHVPLAITALCGFVFGGVLRRDVPSHGRPQVGHPLYVAIHMALIFGVGRSHRHDLGQGLMGPLVGVERPDAHIVPDRDAAVRDLSAAAVLDRGSRAPVPLRERVRGRGRGVRAAELHRGPGGPAVRPPSGADPRRAGTCRDRCG